MQNVVLARYPNTINEAMRNLNVNKWKEAIQTKYASFMATFSPSSKSYKCWTQVGVLHQERFIEKHVCYKVKLVVKVHSQVEGDDFNETFAHVAKFCTIQCMMTIGTTMDLEIHQIDAITTFLNPYLEGEIYIDHPKNFVQQGQ